MFTFDEEPAGFSDLELGREIGRGGWSVVHEAQHRVTGKRFAVKAALSPDGEAVLVAQHRGIVGLRHPNIATSHRLTRLPDGRLAVVLELVDGAAVSRSLPLPTRQRADIALHLARGLAALHGWGVVHGDVSADNVLVTDDEGQGRAVLIDVGTHAAARDTQGFGTPGYIAPEVIRGGRPNNASDVYSAGCVLAEVLGGRSLFADVPPGLRTQHHLTDAPDLAPSIEPAIAELLRAMLSKEPRVRPTSGDVLAHLDEHFGDDRVTGDGMASTLLNRRDGAGLESARAQLAALEAELSAGDGAVRVLLGAPGDGRSFLAREALDAAALRGDATVWLTPAPGQSLLEALARVTDLRLSATRDSVIALAGRLASVAELRPLVLVLDGRARDARELEPAHEVVTVAARIAPVATVVLADGGTLVGAPNEHLLVGRCEHEDRVRMVRAAVGAETPGVDALLGWLGQPAPKTAAALILRLRMAAAVGGLAWRRGGWVIDRERLRLARPDGPPVTDGAPAGSLEAQMLALLGLADGEETVAHVREALGLDEAALLSVLTTLETRGLVERSLRGSAVFVRNPLATRAAVEALGDDERRALHHALAELEYPDLPLNAAVLRQEYHRVCAGRRPHIRVAARTARELAGIRRADRALEFLDALDGFDDWSEHDRVQLGLVRAEIEVREGHLDAGAELLEDLEPVDDEQRVWLAELLSSAGRPKIARERLGREPESPRGRLALARALFDTGDEEGAHKVAHALLDDDSTPPRVFAGAAHLASTHCWRSGRAADAEQLALIGLEECGRDPGIRADLLRAVGIARFYQGQHERARQALAEATTENRILGRVRDIARCLNNLAMVDYARGRWVRAAETWEEFRLFCARAGEAVELANACNNLGYLNLQLGRFSYAASMFRRCIRLAERAGYERIVPMARANLGDALLRTGDLDGAAAAFALAEAQMRAAGAPGHELAELHRRKVELDLRVNGAASALSHIVRHLSERAFETARSERGHLLRLKATCHRRLGHRNEAEAAALGAVEVFDQLDDRYPLALAREELAAVYNEQSRGAEATHEARSALDTYLSLGAQADADRATELHRTLLRTTTAAASSGVRGSEHMLLDVALRLSSTLDLDDLVPLVLERITRVVRAERGLFALLDSDGEVAHAVVHNLEWAGVGHPLPVSRGVLSEAMRSGRVVVVQDVETEGQYASRMSVRLLGIRSMLAVPVKVGGLPIGVIYVDNRTEALQELQSDIDKLSALASLVGVCVQNSRLFRQQRFRGDLLAQMAHDFRTPLCIIRTNAEVIDDDGLPADERTEISTEIAASAVRMNRMIDNTLELARMEHEHAPDPTRIDIAELLSAHLKPLRALLALRDLELELDLEPGLPSATTLRDRLLVVVDNLVFNAIKHAPTGSTLVIKARARPDEGPEASAGAQKDGFRGVLSDMQKLSADPQKGFVEISVYNPGDPIPESIRPRLFSAYVRGESSKNGVKSTGLGLSIARDCVRHLGGRIWVESDEAGNEFAFTLPVSLERRDPTQELPTTRSVTEKLVTIMNPKSRWSRTG